MKLYNPFKPHIVELPNSDLCLRRLTMAGYECLGLDGAYWWGCSISWPRYCATKDKAMLLTALDKYTKSNQRLKVLVNEIL